jgi:TRAP-type transport system periplasmic protein
MPRESLLRASGTAALALVLAAIPVVAPAASVRMRAAHVFDDNHAWHKCFQKFGEIVNARTGGEVEVQIFSRGVLGSEKDYVQHLLLGRLDLAVLAPGWAGNLAKQMSFLDMLFLWRDRAHWAAALDGEVGRKVAEIVETTTAKGGNPGLEVLGYLGGSERYIMSRKQGYPTLKDLEGLKLRVLDSPPQIETWKLLGAVPAPLAFDLTYGAVKTGTVDGLENEMGNAYRMRFHEVAPHVTETAHIITVRPVLMSGHTWRKLTPERQALVMEAAREAVSFARNVEWKQNEEAVAEMKKAGAKFYPFPKKNRDQMREMTKPVREGLARDLGMTDVLLAIERAGAAVPEAKGPR